jgi:glucosamine kinase
MGQHKEHPYIQNILNAGFKEFIKTHICSYPNHKEYYCHFVGSIAYHFEEKLREVCVTHEINVGEIIEKPIDELFNFIQKREGY